MVKMRCYYYSISNCRFCSSLQKNKKSFPLKHFMWMWLYTCAIFIMPFFLYFFWFSSPDRWVIQNHNGKIFQEKKMLLQISELEILPNYKRNIENKNLWTADALLAQANKWCISTSALNNRVINYPHLFTNNDIMSWFSFSSFLSPLSDWGKLNREFWMWLQILLIFLYFFLQILFILSSINT